MNTNEQQSLCISFDEPKQTEPKYRSLATKHTFSSQMYHQNKLNTKQQRIIISDESYTKCKPSNQSFSINTIESEPSLDLHLQPLKIITSQMSIEDDLESPSSITPVSIPPSKAPKLSFPFCNDLNSFFVQNANCAQTLNTLNDILSHYNDEIEFEINAKLNTIEGLVFLSNVCVYFTMYVWAETTKNCRLEFRRMSGDALTAAKFWSDIKSSIETNNYENGIHCGFISLDLDMCAFESEENMQHEFDVSVLNEMTQTMMENNLYVVDELTFLYEQMEKNEQICAKILSHYGFMQQLVNECTRNKDVCVVRIALMILQRLAIITCDNMINLAEIELFYSIDLMLKHKQRLIRQCTMKLLANVCANSKCDWKMNDELKASIVQKIKNCANECGKDMVETICSRF